MGMLRLLNACGGRMEIDKRRLVGRCNRQPSGFAIGVGGLSPIFRLASVPLLLRHDEAAASCVRDD